MARSYISHMFSMIIDTIIFFDSYVQVAVLNKSSDVIHLTQVSSQSNIHVLWSELARVETGDPLLCGTNVLGHI